MPVSAVRRSVVLFVAMATGVILVLLPAGAAAKEPEGLSRFMDAVGEVESSGRYDARNSRSGAYGKYQIMPSNWPVWAKKYLGDANAKQTPENQERVARGKFIDLFKWLDTWPAVAHWWLTGSGERDPGKWSSYSSKYVAKIMRIMAGAPDRPTTSGPGAAPTPKPKAPEVFRYQDTNAAIVTAGAWSKARYRTYAGGTVGYATTRGATARLSFTGRAVSWIGPVGPTRGRARVFVDGKLVRTVDLHASAFSPRRIVFSTGWSTSAAHSLRIEVLGTAGRPYVAIDELRVVR